MSTTFRKTAVLSGELRMAAADAIGHTLRMIVASASKMAGKVNLTNVRFEVIESIPMTVTTGSETGVEIVSIRTTISGSTKNEAAIREAYTQHVVNVQAAVSNDTLKGFIPDVTFVAKP